MQEATLHVTDLAISAAALACLEAAGITDLDQLLGYPALDLASNLHLGAMELYEVVCRLNRHGISVSPEPRSLMQLPGERNHEILRLRIVMGFTLSEIALVMDVSKERVRQILKEDFGLSGTPPAVRARQQYWRRLG
jgi:hypothetical protein